MPRTTLNIEGSVLRELKTRSQRERRPVGDIASELLAGALRQAGPDAAPPERFVMPAFSMGVPLVDLDDKEAVRKALADDRHP